jgi:hypothetical protein
MSLAGLVIRLVSRQSAARFEAATRDPVRVQHEKMLALVRKNARTEYGERHGFGAIARYEDYRERVPVVGYEDIKADMERVTRGAKNVFTAEDPLLFAQTSGTTGDPKYVPVTPTCRGREHGDQMRAWMYHARRSHPGIFAGKVMSMVSPAVEGYTESGIPFGSTSGMIYRDMPGIVKGLYSIPYEVFEIEDYEAKYYVMMRIGLEQDVTLIATANPSSVLKLVEKAHQHGEDLIRDVRDGTLRQDLALAPATRALVERMLKPAPARARELEAARERRGGVLKPGDYWPRLAMIGCWKGGTVGHYLDKFPDWFDPDRRRPVPTRDMGYLSSEFRGSIPLSDEGGKGVLTVATNFYEFVAAEELESKRDDPSSWDFVTVGDLERDKDYYIFVSTSGGLYRYDINDVVRVVGRYSQTPEIVFVRKGRGMTNLTGEKVSVNQIISVFQSASKSTGALPAHFKAEADVEKTRYVFRVEFANQVDETASRAFLEALDADLKALNIEYKAKRDSTRLGDPVLHVMRDGWYERQRRDQVASGKRAFQAKTELLSGITADTDLIRPEVERIVEL